MGSGKFLEGLSTEIGGQMMQDEDSSVEHLRIKPTNVSDDGIDYERVIDAKDDYFKYVRSLKENDDE